MNSIDLPQLWPLTWRSSFFENLQQLGSGLVVHFYLSVIPVCKFFVFLLNYIKCFVFFLAAVFAVLIFLLHTR